MHTVDDDDALGAIRRRKRAHELFQDLVRGILGRRDERGGEGGAVGEAINAYWNMYNKYKSHYVPQLDVTTCGEIYIYCHTTH